MRDLTLLQKILLNTDGTVTRILEVFADEPIQVVRLAHELDLSPVDSPGLELSAGDTVLRRTVLVSGSRSKTPYLYAESVIVPSRLHPAVREGLENTDKPIGVLLAENRVETFREIFEVGEEAAGRCAPYFSIDPEATVIFRTYRVSAGGRPMMMITEKFPTYAFSITPAEKAAVAAEEPAVALEMAISDPAVPDATV